MEIQTIKKQDNCLNLFKLIAALQVMYGHAIGHLEINSFGWFDKLFSVFQGVPIFFTLSGFLIWFSIDRTINSGGYSKYLKKRFWRIYPEMWVAIAVEIIVMCICYKGWNLKDVSLFTVTQATFFQFWTPDSLRGYGCGTPNGSLWTICVTIQFYIVAWLICKLLRNKKWHVWGGAIILSIIVSYLGEIVIGLLNVDVFVKLYNQTIIKYLWMFLLGMWAACFFDKVIPLCKKWWPILLCISLMVSICSFDLSVGYGILKTLFVFLTIVGVAYQFPQLKLKRDISFGLFIYHMTVVNVMITLGFVGKYTDLLIVSIISCILAYISTITIGKYASKKKVV